MATRFYLPASGAAAVTPPTPDSGWLVTTGFAAFAMPTTKSNTAKAVGTQRTKGNASANMNQLDRQYLSTSRLTAQTITGTFSLVLRGWESATALDARVQVIIRVVSSDGTTVRGTLYAGSAAAVSAVVGDEAQELPGTTAAARATRIKNALAVSSVSAQLGDRLLVEIGCRLGSSSTSTTFQLEYGDPTAGADYALTAALTTDLVPWFETSQTLTIAPPLGATTGTWAFNGAAVGKRSPVATTTGTWTEAGAAVGKRSPQGAATGTWTFAGTAVGDTPPNRGTTTGTWTFAGTAAGVRTAKATTTGTWTFAGTAAGIRSPQATTTGTWTFDGTAVGKRAPAATTSGTWTFSGVTAGNRTPVATATGTWTEVGTATGTRAPKGTGAGSCSFTGSASGTAPVPGQSDGTSVGTWTFNGAAVGRRAPQATTTGTWVYIGAAVGTSPIVPPTTGATTGSLTYVGVAVGQRASLGAATGTWTFSVTAFGTSAGQVQLKAGPVTDLNTGLRATALVVDGLVHRAGPTTDVVDRDRGGTPTAEGLPLRAGDSL